MRMRMQPNKFEKEVIKQRAAREGCKPWQIMQEMSDYANECVFKRFFEKEYKASKIGEQNANDKSTVSKND